jgi:hypothetical protein
MSMYSLSPAYIKLSILHTPLFFYGYTMFFYSFNIYKITFNCVTEKPSSAKANSAFREHIYRKNWAH